MARACDDLENRESLQWSLVDGDAGDGRSHHAVQSRIAAIARSNKYNIIALRATHTHTILVQLAELDWST